MRVVRAARQPGAIGTSAACDDGPRLPADEDEGASCNGNDSHESTQPRKAEIEQWD